MATNLTLSIKDDGSRKERRDAAEHRQRILAVARQLFAEQGVDATSMAEIARMADVGQATLYRRYAHKGELCNALIEENVQQFRSDLQIQLDQSYEQKPALVQLELLLTRLAQFNEENAPFLCAILDAACGPRRGAAYQSAIYVWLRETIYTLLTRAVERGEASLLDVECTVDAVLAPLSIDLYLYQRRELGYSSERIIGALRQLLFDGLHAR